MGGCGAGRERGQQSACLPGCWESLGQRVELGWLSTRGELHRAEEGVPDLPAYRKECQLPGEQALSMCVWQRGSRSRKGLRGTKLSGDCEAVFFLQES